MDGSCTRSSNWKQRRAKKGPVIPWRPLAIADKCGKQLGRGTYVRALQPPISSVALQKQLVWPAFVGRSSKWQAGATVQLGGRARRPAAHKLAKVVGRKAPSVGRTVQLVIIHDARPNPPGYISAGIDRHTHTHTGYSPRY